MINVRLSKKVTLSSLIKVPMGQILTTKELAKYLRLTEVTIYKYDKEGKIPVHKVGSRWRFDKDKIDKWLVFKEKKKNTV